MSDNSENATPQGRIALVTGASRGLGAAVAEALAAAGHHVILVARTVGGLEAVDDRIRASGGSATLIPLDLAKFDEVARLGPALHERFGRLDVLVANAAMLGHYGPVAQFDPRMWDRVMALNLTANHRLLQTLDPLLRASPSGRALFVTDGAVKALPAYGGAYAVSKAALEAFVNLYAAETRDMPLRVNLVDPGIMATNLRAQGFPGEDPATLRQPVDMAHHFVRLAAPANLLHGQIIRLADLEDHAGLELSQPVW
jgi:NAD(P)-dependent dehydrogenase (short-subunit alcohol dehydrogenase family)